MSGSTRCWHCGKKLVNKVGNQNPAHPLIFAQVMTQLDQPVRVHKVCVKDTGLRLVIAQSSVDLASSRATA